MRSKGIYNVIASDGIEAFQKASEQSRAKGRNPGSTIDYTLDSEFMGLKSYTVFIREDYVA